MSRSRSVFPAAGWRIVARRGTDGAGSADDHARRWHGNGDPPDAQRFIVIADAAAAPRSYDRLAGAARPAGVPVWHWLDIVRNLAVFNKLLLIKVPLKCSIACVCSIICFCFDGFTS